jgi:hypothetical protein
MMKATSVRQALVKALPDLQNDPDKLLVFIDQGHIVSTLAKGRSFEYRYVLNVIVLDFAGNSDAVFLALLAWLRVNQPDALAGTEPQQEPISFEADHLTPSTSDLSIKLNLSEAVRVSVDARGQEVMEHMTEIPSEWDINGLVA